MSVTSRVKWIAGLVVVAAFVSGIIVGMAADRFLMIRGRRDHLPARATSMMVERLDRRLDLTDDQRTRIEQILRHRHARINAMWSDVRPRVRGEVEATNTEIDAVLTPEQRERFAEMKMRMRGPHGGPPPREK